ncbi:MAG: PAS domain S-box protein, partial [Myxococcales bacterium]|nr:PAS domain S-box protein [Myxococcales bacterium]
MTKLPGASSEELAGQATLEEERDFWRSVAEDPEDWTYWQSPGGALRHVGAGCEALSGYAPAEFRDDPGLLIRIVHPQDRARFAQHLEDERERSPLAPIDFRIVRRDGEVRWIKHRCRPVDGRDGRPLGWRARNVDVTDERRAESAFNALVGSSLQGVLISQRGRFVFANDTAAEILDRPIDELLAMSSQDAAALFQLDQGQDPPRRHERRVVRGDGSDAWIDVVAAPTSFDGRSALRYVFVDITARKEAEEAHRILVESSLQGLIIAQDGRIVFANAAFAAMIGYDPESLTAMSGAELLEIVHPDDRERLLTFHHARLAGLPAPPAYESRWIASDGTIRWIHTTAASTVFHGRPAIQAIYVDVTDRRLADRRLREHGAQLHAIFENAAVAVNLVALDGRFLQVNRRFVELVGYSQDELLQMTAWDLEHPDDVPVVQALGAELLAGERPDFRVELRYVRADGSVFWGDLSVTPIRDDEGVIIGVVGVLVDISARKSATWALHENRARFRDLIARAGVAIGTVSSDGVIEMINDEGARAIGLSPSAVIGLHLSELPLGDAAPVVAGIIDEALRSERIVHGEARFSFGGEDRTYLVSASPIQLSPGETIVQVIAHDISERKR